MYTALLTVHSYVRWVVLLLALLAMGGIVFLGSLWLLDRDVIRDVLQIMRQATPLGRRRPAEGIQ